MKYLIVLFLLTTTVQASGQSSIDFGQFINSWTQGKIDQNGNVIKAGKSRGGSYQLNINSDSRVIFRDPFTCGFGQERNGKWTLNKMDTTVTFIFSKSVGYINSPMTSNINETEIYKIKKLTSDELILKKLSDGIERIVPFIKTK